MVDLKKIKNALDTGEVVLGYQNTIKSLLLSKPKLVIISGDTPQKMRESIEYYCSLSNVPLSQAKENATDLGSSLGRRHTVTALSVMDDGESTILEA
jgi:large subunit ribosomal protein L30e